MKKAIIIGLVLVLLFSGLALLSAPAHAASTPTTYDFSYKGDTYSFYYCHATTDYYDVIYITHGSSTVAIELNFAIASLQGAGNASGTNFPTQYTNDQAGWTSTNTTLDVQMKVTQTWLSSIHVLFNFTKDYFTMHLYYIANDTVYPNYAIWYFNQHGHGTLSSQDITTVYTYQSDRFREGDNYFTLPPSSNTTITQFQSQVSEAPYFIGFKTNGGDFFGIGSLYMHEKTDYHFYKSGYESNNQLALGEWGTRKYTTGQQVDVFKLLFTFGNSQWDMLQQYGDYVTKDLQTRNLPTWAKGGVWYCTWQDELEENNAGTYTEQDVNRWYKALVDHGIRPNAIILDDKWMDHYGDYVINSTRWPNFAQWVSNMHKNGTHVLLWIPIFRVEPSSELYAQHPDWVVKAWGSTTPVEVDSKYYILDPTNSAAVDYLSNELVSLVQNYNIDGYKIDFEFEIADYHSEFYNRYIANTPTDNMWHRAMKIVYDNLHAAKSDIVISQISINPLYFDTMDMSRLIDDNLAAPSWMNLKLYEFKILYYSNLTHHGIVADTDWYWQTLDDLRTYTILPLFGPVSIYSSLYKGNSSTSYTSLTNQDYMNIKAAVYVSKKFPISLSWDFAFGDTIHLTVTSHGQTVAKTLDESTVVYYDGTNAYINSFDTKTLKVSDIISYKTYTIKDLTTGHTVGASTSFTAEAGHTYEIYDTIQQTTQEIYGMITAVIPLFVLAMVVGMIGLVMKEARRKW